MVDIKSRERFFERDPTNEVFPLLTLETHYDMVSEHCSVHKGVPEDVRSYFNTVVTLYLHGWLYYPFYSQAGFLSTFVIEMALRKRFPAQKLNKRGRDPRSLRALLTEAKNAGFLRDEDFPSLAKRQANADYLNEILDHETSVQPGPPYADILIGCLPEVRNSFAHPNMHSVMPPGPSLNPLILTAEIMNQLWPKPDPETSR